MFKQNILCNHPDHTQSHCLQKQGDLNFKKFKFEYELTFNDYLKTLDYFLKLQLK